MRKSIYYLFTVVLAGLVVAVGMAQKASAAGTAKNVILIIGDGMGPQQVGLLLTYAHAISNHASADTFVRVARGNPATSGAGYFSLRTA